MVPAGKGLVGFKRRQKLKNFSLSCNRAKAEKFYLKNSRHIRPVEEKSKWSKSLLVWILSEALYVHQQSEPTVNSINTIISEDMRSQLSATFTTGEVQIALKQLTPLKAPGLDGMPPLFYQNFWNLTGNDVTESVLKFLNFASLPE